MAENAVRECGAYCGVVYEGRGGVHHGGVKAPFDKHGSINTWLKPDSKFAARGHLLALALELVVQVLDLVLTL